MWSSGRPAFGCGLGSRRLLAFASRWFVSVMDLLPDLSLFGSDELGQPFPPPVRPGLSVGLTTGFLGSIGKVRLLHRAAGRDRHI